MEYDTERAGGFEPLPLLPKDRVAALGLVTTKSGQLESKDEIKRRIARRRSSPMRISSASRRNAAFASTEEGNVLAEEEQWAKLRMIVEIADEVWA
jgi:5-methyltetrahydropteroyltriglutamate--homocysteine methyltransferase